ncbi:MAG: hypothetical protein ACOX1W_01705 [Catenisphaera adipataccumulans]|uniref:hypothetical protein n=1 Tax=Catenisphaera adipataccumulans TaxID=700500 RepID=UPI003D933475
MNFITTIVGVILIINAGPAHSAGRLSSRTLALKSGPRLLVYPIIMLVIGILPGQPVRINLLDQIMKICGHPA